MNSVLKISRFTSRFNKNLKLNIKCSRTCSTETTEKTNENLSKVGGYAKAFKKFETQLNEKDVTEIQAPKTFSALLRNSNFIDVTYSYFKIFFYIYRLCFSSVIHQEKLYKEE